MKTFLASLVLLAGVFLCSPPAPAQAPVDSTTANDGAKSGATNAGGCSTFDSAGKVACGGAADESQVDIRHYGAVNSTTIDNCAAITRAAQYAATLKLGMLFIPSGNYGTSCTVPWLTSMHIQGRLFALSGGSAATALIATGNTVPQRMQETVIDGYGYIDGNRISAIDVWILEAFGVQIKQVTLMGFTSAGVYGGDDAGVGLGGFGIVLKDVNFGLLSNAVTAGSKCVYLSGGNGTRGGFTDSILGGNTFHGCTIGAQDKVGGNNRYYNNDAWDKLMTTCYDWDFRNGGTSIGDECDTPLVDAWHIHGSGARLFNNVAYLNNLYAPDNAVVAVHFDTLPDPGATVQGLVIHGQDARHRFAADTNLGLNTVNTRWCSNTDTNVVKLNLGTECIEGGATMAGQLHMKGSIDWSNSTPTCSAGACAFNASASNVLALTLERNVTSSTLTGSGSTMLLFHLCQPPGGGPYTFAWMSNSTGMGAIGTKAGTCSEQLAYWDGQRLRAISAMQVNE